MSNKLQVIDSTKLNDLLNAFERDRGEKKLLEGISDPKLLQLREIKCIIREIKIFTKKKLW